LEKSKLMRLNEVLTETAMAKTKLYRLVSQGRFPRQLKHGDGSVVWARQDVDSWVDCLIKGEKYELEKVG
jgi:prophage regulatory protein